MRHEDVRLIAVGKLKYIKDNRFRIINQDNSEEWMLIIRSLKKSDEGLYECQVNASPMLRLTIYLNVVGTNPHYNFFGAKILIVYKARCFVIVTGRRAQCRAVPVHDPLS